MSARRMSHVAILAALSIVLRFAFGAFPNIKPLTAIFLVCLFHLPLLDSLLVMALTMWGSSFLFGFSVVVWWQVVSYAVLMLVWRFLVIPLTEGKKAELIWQSGLAASLTFLYSLLIGIPTAYQFGVNLWIYWLNGLGFDILHAGSTALFYPFIYSIFRRLYREKN